MAPGKMTIALSSMDVMTTLNDMQTLSVIVLLLPRSSSTITEAPPQHGSLGA